MAHLGPRRLQHDCQQGAYYPEVRPVIKKLEREQANVVSDLGKVELVREQASVVSDLGKVELERKQASVVSDLVR